MGFAIAPRPVVHHAELFAIVQELAPRHSDLSNACSGWGSLDLHWREELLSGLAMGSDHKWPVWVGAPLILRRGSGN